MRNLCQEKSGGYSNGMAGSVLLSQISWRGNQVLTTLRLAEERFTGLLQQGTPSHSASAIPGKRAENHRSASQRNLRSTPALSHWRYGNFGIHGTAQA